MNKMKGRSVILAGLFMLGSTHVMGQVGANASTHASTQSSDKSCNPDDPLGAVYKIQIQQPGQDKAMTQSLELWRQGTQVAIRYPDRHITELWQQTPNGRLMLVRYFDEYQRGIEYQPVEIGGNQDWSVKRQLVSDELLARMDKEKTTGAGCEMQTVYRLQDKGRTLAVNWLPGQSLLQSLEISESSSRGSVQWTLEKTIEENQQVSDVFNTLADFQITDYTDVGDMEDDPFLAKMINQGFIEHGASGFYDAEGHDIGDHHH